MMFGGGNYGYAGVILSQEEYPLLTGGTDFATPTNLTFPTTLNTNSAIRTGRLLYTTRIKIFETWMGMCQTMHMNIANNINKEWLNAIKHRTLRFTHQTQQERIKHLESISTDLDNMDITKLSTKLHKPWDQIENPATLFARGDKYEKQLEKAGIQTSLELCLALAKAVFCKAGKYNNAILCFKANTATH